MFIVYNAYAKNENVHLYSDNDGNLLLPACAAFNSPGGCKNDGCPFPHRCSCGGETHTIGKCYKFKLKFGGTGGRGDKNYTNTAKTPKSGRIPTYDTTSVSVTPSNKALKRKRKREKRAAQRRVEADAANKLKTETTKATGAPQ